MFHQLVASRRPEPALTGSAGVALLAHVLCIAGAVWATLRPGAPASAAAPRVVIVWPEAPHHGDAGNPPLRAPVPAGIDEPIVVPLPPDVSRVGAPPPVERTWLVATRGGAYVPAPGAGGSDAWNAAFVDEPPVLLAGWAPAYPEPLRTAGITGRVVVRAVVDTSGRVEPASIVAVTSANPAFEAAARAYIMSARFRPARVRGRAVRVLIQLPIDFRLTGMQ